MNINNKLIKNAVYCFEEYVDKKSDDPFMLHYAMMKEVSAPGAVEIDSPINTLKTSLLVEGLKQKRIALIKRIQKIYKDGEERSKEKLLNYLYDEYNQLTESIIDFL